MPVVSVVFGLLLSALGAYCFAAAKETSYTALTPTGVGVVLILCGVVGFKESLLKHAMHAAAMVGLLGFLAGAGRFAYVALSKGVETDGDVNKAVATVGMAVLCGAFVGFCVNSFMQARRRRRAAQLAATA